MRLFSVCYQQGLVGIVVSWYFFALVFYLLDLSDLREAFEDPDEKSKDFEEKKTKAPYWA